MFMTTNFFIMLAIVVYLAIMLVIGFVYSKRNNSTEDFYLGGRKMGPLVTAMSAEASDMSSWHSLLYFLRSWLYVWALFYLRRWTYICRWRLE